MRKFLLAVFVLLSVCASAQVNNSFRGTLNVFSASGLAPNYRVTGFFSDANGYYSSDSCQVGDVIFAFYTTTCVRFVVDSIITKAGSIITADVIDVDSITAAFPFGVTAIMRETATNGYPVNISGISGPLSSCIETHFKGLVDQFSGTGGAGGPDRDTITQVGHGFTLPSYDFIPVYYDRDSSKWFTALANDTLKLHSAYVVELIGADTIVLQENGLLNTTHGLIVGRDYFLTDAGAADTIPGINNDWLCTVWDTGTLALKATRPIYAGEIDTVTYLRDTTVFDGDITGPYDNLQIKTGVVDANELASTAVTPGSYTTANITVDADGRITSAASGVALSDGDKGDITVSSSGSVWEIDAGAVTSTEILDGTITTTDLAFTINGGSGVANQVTYWSNTNTLAGDTDFQFDGTNISIGTTPVASNRFTTRGAGATSSTANILSQNSSGNTLFQLRDDGTILARYLGRTPGAGTEGTTMLWSLNSNISDTIPSTTRYGLFNNIHYTFGNTVGNASSKISGIYSNANFSTSANGRLANIRAFEGVVSTSQISQVLTGSMYGMELSFSNAITGLGNNPETGGLYISGVNSGRIQNTYGVRIGDITSGTQDNQAYSIYTGDLSARNYFGGNNQLGDGSTINYVGVGYTPGSSALMILKGPNNTGGRPRLLIGNGTAPQIHNGTNDMSHAALHVYANWESDTQTPRTFTSLVGQTGILSIAQPATQSHSQSIYGYLSNNGNITFNQYSYNTVGYFLMNHASRTVAISNGIAAINRRDFEFVGVYCENTFSGGSIVANDLGVAPNVNTYGGRFVAIAPTTSADAAAANNVYGIVVNTSGSAINAYGLAVSASGSTTNWSIYSDEGQHWFEDEIRVGGTASTPTANIDVDGSQRFRAISTPGSVEDGEMWTSSTQKALVANQAGVTQALVGTIFTGTADATVANTVTETTLIPTGVGTVTLPANFLVAGKTIKIDAWGTYLTADPASTLEIRAELGGTLLATTAANTLTVCEGGQWHAEVIVTCRSTGVSGTTYSQGEVRMSHVVDAHTTYWMRRSATNTIDTTTSNALDLTATHGAADPDNSITLTNITVTVLN